ncbi:MAG: hypothetical protein WC394_02890 [Candidatus Omnitrophota bacterium]|jgi:AAA+ ATPase superfamily predicted ATPase
MKGEREVVIYVGKSRSGKSTLLQRMIEKEPRFIIFDTVSEYSKITPPFSAVFINDVHSLFDYLEANGNKAEMRVIFDPEDYEEQIQLVNGEKLNVFDLACKNIFEGLSQVAFGIEEIANFVKGSSYQKYFSRMIRAGRHKNISIYATTQRPMDIRPVLRAQITKLISFYQQEPKDIEWIGDFVRNKQEAEGLFKLTQFVWPGPMICGKHYKEFNL